MDGFGRDLGIAFQIADDLLDVLGEEQTTGKSLGTDLEKQKPTLPVIRALELATPADREDLLELLTGDQRRPHLVAPILNATRPSTTPATAPQPSPTAPAAASICFPRAPRATFSP